LASQLDGTDDESDLIDDYDNDDDGQVVFRSAFKDEDGEVEQRTDDSLSPNEDTRMSPSAKARAEAKPWAAPGAHEQRSASATPTSRSKHNAGEDEEEVASGGALGHFLRIALAAFKLQLRVLAFACLSGPLGSVRAWSAALMRAAGLRRAAA
jgi:hypothetical protein